MNLKVGIFFIVMLFSCVGVDYVNDPVDPIRGNSIAFTNLENVNLALMINTTQEVDAVYYDIYGLPRNYPIVWQSANTSVATVEDGLITAIGAGNTMIVASFETASLAIDLTVVADDVSVASVSIDEPVSTSLAIGETKQLSAEVKTISGNVLDGKVIEWFSENSEIVTVSSNGLVEGKGNGVAEVHAKSEGVKSNSIIFSVGTSNQRVGQFIPAGGYQASGTATLRNSNGQLLLELSSNFQTSFALGTFVYLSNSTSGALVKSGGLEVAQITSNGAKSFNITSINPSVDISTYKYVIILCKPASVTFGYAEMK